MKKRYLWGGAAAVVCLGLYAMNASWLAPTPKGDLRLLAHRGIHQEYDHTNLKMDDCTATRILPPTNDYLENTLPSMKAALDAGADVIEIDVHPTTDGEFAVFHDWGVDCRTDGHGVTREHTMAELKQLDIGYGYTADGGKTFPFRGKFKGMMPTLQETLTAFPQTHFLINIKSNDPHEADLLVDYLTKRHLMSDRLTTYGGDKPMARFAVLAPQLQPFGRKSVKACGLGYLTLGWSGYMPKACHNTALFVPQNLAWLAWGYPNRLQDRFAAAGSYLYLVGPLNSKEKLQGIDTPRDLAKVPKSWKMGVLTNAIDTVGPAEKAAN